MNALDLAGASPPRSIPRWLPPIGGLLAASAVALWLYPTPHLFSLSTSELLGSAVERVLAVLLANAITVWALNAISQRSLRTGARLLIRQTSLSALWLAPLVLFIRESSAWVTAITAVLVAGIVSSIRLVQASRPAVAQEFPPLSPRSNPFSLLESSPGFQRQVCGAGAALSVQIGAIASLAGYPFLSLLLVAASSAFWTWSFTRDNPKSAAPSHSSSRAVLVVSLAIIFTAGALLPFLRPMYGMSRFGMPNFARYANSNANPRGEEGDHQASGASLVPPADGDPGVILLPDKLTHTKLVAPAPVIGDPLLTGQGSVKPLEIPFEGVYWFFRAPDVHPPRSSREAHGSPELLDIRSTDRRPLSMEARENLGSIIDLNCCSRIQVAIRNADHYPDTVSIELVLIDSTASGKPSQSLGSMMVTSTRPWRLYRRQSPPVTETLNFVLPARSALRRFDEVRIVFRIDAVRADTGPKIAIDRLVLIPRGL